MVTLQKIGDRHNRSVLQIVGLSTDVKPTVKVENMPLTNGSIYVELNTGKRYLFDEENKMWYLNSSNNQSDPGKNPIIGEAVIGTATL